MTDTWASGDVYEAFMGRWSAQVAPLFLSWLDQPAGERWLDVGCGTGVLTRAIVERQSPAAVLGVDPSAGFVCTARERSPHPEVAFVVADAQDLPVRDGAAGTAVSGLVLNFVPDRARALAELRRVVGPHGVVGAYFWDLPGRMDLLNLFWDAAVAVDPGAAAAHESRRFAFCEPVALRDMFAAAGFSAVTVEQFDIAMRFRDFDDYWTPFLGGQGPAPSYLAQLDEARRDLVAARLRETLPVEPDGSIVLAARAWGVRAGS